ncbi:MAG: FMN-binding negative transcriptional regulator [Pseudomonadota bacterium]
MYVPSFYQEDRRDILLETIRSKSFGTLITQGANGIDVTHLPFAVEGDALVGHVARANPQWERMTPGSEAVATFVIDDAYIHPGWYPSKIEHGRAVPTWNYIAVEARGTLEWLHGGDALRPVLDRLTADQEASRNDPWGINDAPDAYIEGMLKAIVGFRLTLTDLSGAWKLDQKKKDADRLAAADGVAVERPHSSLPEKMRAV